MVIKAFHLDEKHCFNAKMSKVSINKIHIGTVYLCQTGVIAHSA